MHTPVWAILHRSINWLLLTLYLCLHSNSNTHTRIHIGISLSALFNLHIHSKSASIHSWKTIRAQAKMKSRLNLPHIYPFVIQGWPRSSNDRFYLSLSLSCFSFSICLSLLLSLCFQISFALLSLPIPLSYALPFSIHFFLSASFLLPSPSLSVTISPFE